jgi:hypothetical protein
MEQPQEAAAAIDVDQIATQIKQLAPGLHLIVVPSMLLRNPNGWGLLAPLDDLNAADFCELASTAGAKLLVTG